MADSDASAAGVYVDPFPGRRGSERVASVCTRCDGRGWLNLLMDNGRCWGCGGSGEVSVLVSSARATARRRARQAAARVEEESERLARLSAGEERALAAMRAELGGIVDVALDPRGHGEGDSGERRRFLEAVCSQIYDVRDGYKEARAAVEQVREWRLAEVAGATRGWRDFCVACRVKLGRDEGVILTVGHARYELCREHAPNW